MKKFKFLMPMMAFVMAISMAYATKANPETGLWVQRDGEPPYELKSNPCSSEDEIQCRVVFADDPNEIEYLVYENQNLTIPKLNGSSIPYTIME